MFSGISRVSSYVSDCEAGRQFEWQRGIVEMMECRRAHNQHSVHRHCPRKDVLRYPAGRLDRSFMSASLYDQRNSASDLATNFLLQRTSSYWRQQPQQQQQYRLQATTIPSANFHFHIFMALVGLSLCGHHLLQQYRPHQQQ